jgi:peptidoglycan/xylan/chitin deacetylase (PgdA/CDA1 family)
MALTSIGPSGIGLAKDMRNKVNLRRLPFWPGAASHRVLYCHEVEEAGSGFYPGGLNPPQLVQRVELLRRAGCRFVGLGEAVRERLRGGKDRFTASLCTDDGLASNYHTLFPLARKLGIPLTLFLIGKCIDNKALAWNHKLILIRNQAPGKDLLEAVDQLRSKYRLDPGADISASLFSVSDQRKEELADELWQRFLNVSQEEYLRERKPYLSSGQITEMLAAGVELGSHGFSHADLSRLSYEQIKGEIVQAGEVLNSLSGGVVSLFAFPYTRSCDPALLPRLARETGIEAFFGGRYSLSDNRGRSLLWQRQKLELPWRQYVAELYLKPGLRSVARNFY